MEDNSIIRELIGEVTKLKVEFAAKTTELSVKFDNMAREMREYNDSAKSLRESISVLKEDSIVMRDQIKSTRTDLEETIEIVSIHDKRIKVIEQQVIRWTVIIGIAASFLSVIGRELILFIVDKTTNG